ncbi:hypothetical protein HID58_017911 [Brassica napus]|uniref:Secreted peptide n=1 Tax=Brassica napus TaxID=3708 RepID=A0ABQ8D8E6_BRANA|nr:hypothetical protein HID58_017911 [Brassica napus]
MIIYVFRLPLQCAVLLTITGKRLVSVLLFSLSSRMTPRFVDFILSHFISLFSHLVAPFIADHVFGGSPFRRICYSRLFMVSSLSFGFFVIGFHSHLTQSFLALRWHERIL